MNHVLLAQRFDPPTQGFELPVGLIVFVVLLVVFIMACNWIIYAKAGKPGWAALIPIYNMIVLLEIVNRPIWWFLLLLIPCVGIVIAVLVTIDLAKSFGKDAGYAIGLILLPIVFYPLLAFGGATYQPIRR